MGQRLAIVFVAALTAAAAEAVVLSRTVDPLHEKQLRHPDLDYRTVFRPVADLPLALSRELGNELVGLGVDPGDAFFDLRTGRWGTLILSRPLVPGPGIGNDLAWSDLGRAAPSDSRERRSAVWEAFRDFLSRHAAALRVDLAELAEPRLAAHGERVVQLHVGRQLGGIPVRGAFLKATVNSGNLILLGFRDWGDPALDTTPRTSAAAAEASLREHLGAIRVAAFRGAPRLEIVPVSSLAEEVIEVPGEGLSHRLVWVLSPSFADSLGTWEALVDAHSGELLAFMDTNRYATRRVVGGIFPESNDGTPPDGVEQPGYPMPFADLTLDGEFIGFTDTGGNVASCRQGTLGTRLSGRYIRMHDDCGEIDESAAAGNLDLGTGPGTDCLTPGVDHSWGDTHAARTAFYELNRIAEQARGFLPDNAWLDRPLTANTNVFGGLGCNAYWNGDTVNFLQRGLCANTGELAGALDHEWGHGMDDNDTDGMISTPGESIADIFAQNRLNDSCLARGYRLFEYWDGYGDPSVTCDGVREADWTKRESGEPHDIDWIQSPFDGPSGGGGCVNVSFPPFPTGPCGEEAHCEGTIVAEAAWDLVHRDLMGYEGSEIDLDPNTALELGTRLAYYGSSNVGNWYQCQNDGTGGCNADGGYLNLLAVDDDNGNLGDGTPHMTAIFAAFDRHQLACPTPAVQNSGCAGGPTAAPANVVATRLDKGVHLTWNPVSGANEYWIYRAEGVDGCTAGKTRVGETTATEFVETGLRNDFKVFYSVVAVGDSDACTSPMSACRAVIPRAAPGLGFDPRPLGWEGLTGDGDASLDNCEAGWLEFRVNVTGTGAVTRPRIVAARVLSHPNVDILTALPARIAPRLPECGSATGRLLIRGAGLGFDDTLEIELSVTSDELHPAAVTHVYTLPGLESDFDFQTSRRFQFEAGKEGWKTVRGTFNRSGASGGAEGTDFYLKSSSFADERCDRIRSPLLRLTETSTLKLYNRFHIEPELDGVWWFDRANVGLFDPHSGLRTVVTPDGGRLYNAGGQYGACVTQGQPGWAGTRATWQASTWSAGALGARELADDLVRLDVAYGTDAEVALAGFRFDQVSVTDVFVQGHDTRGNACPAAAFAATGLAVDPPGNDVLEPGESARLAPAWTNVGALARSLTGSGQDFNGPGPSSIYRIRDAAARYASVSPGVEADCRATGNCYAVSISTPSDRPLRHWDATFDESVSTGTEKSWILHVGESFADASTSNLFYPFIETMLHHGVTAGCTDSDYCPAASTSRAQMPVFVLRALEGPGYAPPACQEGMEAFADVAAANPFCPWIEELAEREIVVGCGDNNYCPSDPVTRAQMALFALRTFEGGAYTPAPCHAGSEEFDDVSSTNLFCSWIEELARRGVVEGCGGGNYCPANPVARGQMAVFISRTFGLALYGP